MKQDNTSFGQYMTGRSQQPAERTYTQRMIDAISGTAMGIGRGVTAGLTDFPAAGALMMTRAATGGAPLAFREALQEIEAQRQRASPEQRIGQMVGEITGGTMLAFAPIGRAATAYAPIGSRATIMPAGATTAVGTRMPPSEYKTLIEQAKNIPTSPAAMYPGGIIAANAPTTAQLMGRSAAIGGAQGLTSDYGGDITDMGLNALMGASVGGVAGFAGGALQQAQALGTRVAAIAHHNKTIETQRDKVRALIEPIENKLNAGDITADQYNSLMQRALNSQTVKTAKSQISQAQNKIDILGNLTDPAAITAYSRGALGFGLQREGKSLLGIAGEVLPGMATGGLAGAGLGALIPGADPATVGALAAGALGSFRLNQQLGQFKAALAARALAGIPTGAMDVGARAATQIATPILTEAFERETAPENFSDFMRQRGQ